jgi:hypothetical protein
MTDVRDETEHVALPEQRSASAGGAAPPCEAVRGKHVLIVGINYWPEPTGIAPCDYAGTRLPPTAAFASLDAILR